MTSIQVAQKYTCPVKCDMSVCSECQVIAHCVWIDEIQATLGHSLPCLYYSERFKTWFIFFIFKVAVSLPSVALLHYFCTIISLARE